MRRPEPQYAVWRRIAEFWNTVSNLPFVLIGLARLGCSDLSEEGSTLYSLYVAAGLCSAFHHACPFAWRWTLAVDMMPIGLSLWFFTGHPELLCAVTLVSWFKVNLALLAGLLDHAVQLVPVPWGHVGWHILAALAMDAVYQDMEQR